MVPGEGGGCTQKDEWQGGYERGEMACERKVGSAHPQEEGENGEGLIWFDFDVDGV